MSGKPECENCGTPTWDWRDGGFFCSDECVAEYTQALLDSL